MYIFLYIYLLHGAESFLKLVLQLVKKFPALLEPEGSSPHSQVPATSAYPQPTPSSPHNPLPLPEDPSYTLSSHLRLGLPNGLFPSGFPTRTLCTPLPYPIRATCPTHLILLDFTTRTISGKEYRSLNSSLCNFLHLNYNTVSNYNRHNVKFRPSQWPRGLRRGSAAARLLGLWVRIPREAWMFVSVVCCQVEVSASGRSLVQRSPTECGVSVCDDKSSLAH